MRPSPTVKNRFSSISSGTLTCEGLRNFAVKAVAVAVSLKAGSLGRIGLETALPFLALWQGADMY